MFRRHLRYLPLLLLLTVTTTQASDSYSAVASFFAEYDNMLEQVAAKAQRVTSLSATEKMFAKQIEEYSCASYFLRTNSKGKIIAKVTEKGIQPRAFRFVGKQKWFEIISMTNKPYYGYTKRKSSYYLFWNKPIHVKKKGALQFGGSISAKINMRKSFKTIAEQEGVSFKVSLKNRILFSNLPKGATDLLTKPLSIGGLPVLTISYPAEGGNTVKAVSKAVGKSSVVSESKPKKIGTPKREVAATNVAATKTESTPKDESVNKSKVVEKEESTQKAKPTKEEVKKEQTAKKEESKNTVTDTEKKAKSIPMGLVIGITSLALLCIIWTIVIIGRVRNRKLLEAIENDEL